MVFPRLAKRQSTQPRVVQLVKNQWNSRTDQIQWKDYKNSKSTVASQSLSLRTLITQFWVTIWPSQCLRKARETAGLWIKSMKFLRILTVRALPTLSKKKKWLIKKTGWGQKNKEKDKNNWSGTVTKLKPHLMQNYLRFIPSHSSSKRLPLTNWKKESSIWQRIALNRRNMCPQICRFTTSGSTTKP